MKTIDLMKFLAIALIILVCSCENSTNSIPPDESFFQGIINYDLEQFKQYDSANFSSNKYYKRAISIKNSAENIIRELEKGNTLDDSIKHFLEEINTISA